MIVIPRFATLMAVLVLFTSSEIDSVNCTNEKPLVETSYGKIEGVRRNFPHMNMPITSVNKFLGIPYAAPPIGKLRFQPPSKPSTWKPEVYNASFFRNICIQPPEYNELFWPNFFHPESEDCLYLNVYTPLSNTSAARNLFPVMVYIHGGGYEVGTPVVSPGDIIPLWSVVLVTIQYRLGPFGFVTTGDAKAPGNYGMLDQIEALKWVQENIEAFGGDRSKVTIFGESAGGSSVGLLLMSPLSKGLFLRAIPMSGVELSPFAIGAKANALSHTKELASRLGCPVKESAATIKCLRSIDAPKLVKIYDAANIWRPVVDGKFLTDTPENLRRTGKFHHLDLMSGFTSQEGAYFFPSLISEVTSNTFRHNIKVAISYIISKYGQTHTPSYKLPERLLDAIVFMYTPWPYIHNATKFKIGFADAVTDSCVAEPTHASLLSHSAQSPVYMYEFAFRSKLNPADDWLGVRHKDDTPYQFGFPLMNLTVLQNYTEEDRNVSKLIITLFTNFAKYGNPTPQPLRGVTWKQFNATYRAYLRIKEQPEMAINFFPTRMAFWDEYYKTFLKEKECLVKARASRGTHACCKETFSYFFTLILIIVAFSMFSNRIE